MSAKTEIIKISVRFIQVGIQEEPFTFMSGFARLMDRRKPSSGHRNFTLTIQSMNKFTDNLRIISMDLQTWLMNRWYLHWSSTDNLVQSNTGKHLILYLTKEGQSYIGSFNIVLNSSQYGHQCSSWHFALHCFA